MRALWISLAVFGMVVSFGLGIFVGAGPFGGRAETPVFADDPLTAPPPIAAPGAATPDLAAAGAAPPALEPPPGVCRAEAARQLPVRPGGAAGKVHAAALGRSCPEADIRITIDPGGGAKPYQFAAPAAELGFASAAATQVQMQADIEGFLLRLLPDRPRSTADLPAWDEALGGPAGGSLTTALTAEEWERIRAAASPLLCHPTSSFERACIALDPADGALKIVGAEARG
jgi:hypothetical protein